MSESSSCDNCDGSGWIWVLRGDLYEALRCGCK